MERRLSAATVVAIWGIANTVLVAVLIGFIAARSGSGLDIVLYCASAALVFALALLTWLAWRRHPAPLALGLRVPHRPAAVLLLAVGVALIWLGLPFGGWLALSAIVPLTAALMLEISARRASRG
jgi:hypothetical protein